MSSMSSRLLSLLAAVAISPVVTASPASAEPSPTALTASIHENHFDGWDIALGALSGVAGFSVGALGGGAIGAASAGGCAPDSNDHSFMGRCFLHGLGETVLGGVIGGTLGAAGGIYAYGELSGHDGGFGATLAGTSLGSLAGIGLFALSEGVEGDVPKGVVLGLGLTLPIVGGLLGYGLSNDAHGDDSGVTSGALVDIGRDGHVRLAIPAVGVSLPRDGELVVALPVIGGAI